MEKVYVKMSIWDAFSYSVVGVSIVLSALAVVAVAIALIIKSEQLWSSKTQKKDSSPAGNNIVSDGIDETTVVILTAAVAAVFQGKAKITRFRVCGPARHANNWSQIGAAVLHESHNIKR